MFESDVKIALNRILVVENNDSDRTFFIGSIVPALSVDSCQGHFDEARDYRQALRLVDSNNECYSGCVIGKVASFKDRVDKKKVTLDLVERLKKLGMEYSAIAIISRDTEFFESIKKDYGAINIHYNPISVQPKEKDFNLREINTFLFGYAQRLVGQSLLPQQQNQ